VEMAGMTQFVFDEPSEGGARYGIPGGMGSHEGSRLLQAIYVGIAVIDVVLLFTGIGELIEGLVELTTSIFRLGRRLITELPNLLRLGWRGLRRLIPAIGEFLVAGGRKLLPA